MPDYEGLIRVNSIEWHDLMSDAPKTGPCHDPNYEWGRVACPEGRAGCLVEHWGWTKLERSLADRIADLERAASKPALTGEQVRAAFYEEFGEWFRHPKVKAVASETTGPIAEAWDRVAARLTK